MLLIVLEWSERAGRKGPADLSKDQSLRLFRGDVSETTASLIREIRYSTQIVILWMAIFSLANVVVLLGLLCFLVGRP